MILSRACEYAVQALIYATSQRPERFLAVRDVALATRIPMAYLSKIIQRLVARGLLSSRKGPRGGVRLARLAGAIKVLDIVEAIDGLGFLNRCVIGHPRCSETHPCPLHDAWGPLRDEIQGLLARRSLGDLVRELRGRGLPGRRS
ncbi:MAG: Rrf2 family transcriptional regulator [Planctomycetes bacterium]|nr:Rrf2 family transcriptional regulator [Planctomycetota bacterium]